MNELIFTRYDKSPKKQLEDAHQALEWPYKKLTPTRNCSNISFKEDKTNQDLTSY